MSTRTNTDDPDETQVAGNFTTGRNDEITFARNGTLGSVRVYWYLVEFVSGVTVQRGSANLTGTTTVVNIGAVDLTKSFPLVSYRQPGVDWDGNDFVQARLPSSTQLQLDVAEVPNAPAVVEWQVVEYADAVVRTHDVNMVSNETLASVVPGYPVDPSKMWLIYSYSAPDSDEKISRYMIRGFFDGGGGFSFDRYNDGVDVAISAFVVEFTDVTTLQHGTASWAIGPPLNLPVVIPGAVDLASTIAVGGYMTKGGKSNLDVSDSGISTAWAEMKLTGPNSMIVHRGRADEAAQIEWSVIAFSPPAPTYAIAGTVFEDVNYGGGAGRDQVTSSGVVRSGARVELYDAAGVYLTFMTTDGTGSYSLDGLIAGDYTVRVVNSTVSSSRSGYIPGLLGVQTFRTDASSGSPVPLTDRVGGQDPNVADAGNGSAGATMNTTTGVFTAVVTGTAQSITNVTLGASDIGALDFGFNFDTIVNTNDDGQGSLRQFLLNANALGNAGLAQVGQPAGKEVSIFMIPVAQLTSGIAVIVPATKLPAIAGAYAGDTSIDGTTQTANIGNTNLGVSGTGFLGAGGTVGVGADGVDGTADEPALSQIEAPEVEIKNLTTVRTGLDVQTNSITIRGIAIHGFGQNLDADIDGNIRVGLDGTTDFTGTLIEKNVIGATAFNFVVPPTRTDGDGVIVRGADGGILRNNLIGFHYRSGIKTHDDANGWLIEDNEFRGNGTTTRYGDGIDLGYVTTTATISRNLLVDNGASGVDSYESNGFNTITNNTITGNGFAGQANQETSGIRLFGTDNDVTLNLIQNNFGAGVLVVGDGTALNQPSLRNEITLNSFSGNGSNAIDLLAGGGDRNFGDGITLNGSAPNDCSYLTSTGNDGIEYPVISSAVLSGGTTTIVGQACPSSDIEVYRALAGAGDASGGTDYGEGERYLGSTTTDGAGDFALVTTVPTVGDAVSAIVIDADGNTSEFGPNVPVSVTPQIVKIALQSDGTPIASGSTLPSGTPVKFLIYIANYGGALTDVSLQDVLDPVFAYQSGSMNVDNTLAASVVCPAEVCDEAAIFSQVDGSGTAVGDGDAVTAPIDADEASYDGGTRTIDLGDQNNAENAQLNIEADSVWSLVFTIRMQ